MGRSTAALQGHYKSGHCVRWTKMQSRAEEVDGAKYDPMSAVSSPSSDEGNKEVQESDNNVGTCCLWGRS
eukprot:4642742-Amphidinium_carterae.1